MLAERTPAPQRHRRDQPLLPRALSRDVFGEQHYARQGRVADPAETLEIERLERQWREAGRTALPGYFRAFGVLCAQDEIKKAREQAASEAKKNNQRAPSTAEHESIRVLRDVLRELAPEVLAVFDKGTTSYTVARTVAILGELKSGRSYRSREVFLAESIFDSEFAHALAVFLHEHAHIFGNDGSRGFTDALTELLETVVRHRRDLDQFEQAWEHSRNQVQIERRTVHAAHGAEDELSAWLDGLTDAELRQLLRDLPPVALRRLRSRRADDPEGKP